MELNISLEDFDTDDENDYSTDSDSNYGDNENDSDENNKFNNENNLLKVKSIKQRTNSNFSIMFGGSIKIMSKVFLVTNHNNNHTIKQIIFYPFFFLKFSRIQFCVM